MSKTKKEKKAKKKQKQLEKVQAENQKFDIIELLENEQLDTKPNFAKFLDKYVERIAVVVSNGKIQFYPIVKYSFPKILIKFLDDHELIYEADVLPGNLHYCMYNGLDEIRLKANELAIVERFFDLLLRFKFIPALNEP